MDLRWCFSENIGGNDHSESEMTVLVPSIKTNTKA